MQKGGRNEVKMECEITYIKAFHFPAPTNQ